MSMLHGSSSLKSNRAFVEHFEVRRAPHAYYLLTVSQLSMGGTCLYIRGRRVRLTEESTLPQATGGVHGPEAASNKGLPDSPMALASTTLALSGDAKDRLGIWNLLFCVAGMCSASDEQPFSILSQTFTKVLLIKQPVVHASSGLNKSTQAPGQLL